MVRRPPDRGLDKADCRTAWSGKANCRTAWSGKADCKTAWSGKADCKTAWSGKADCKTAWSGSLMTEAGQDRLVRRPHDRGWTRQTARQRGQAASGQRTGQDRRQDTGTNQYVTRCSQPGLPRIVLKVLIHAKTGFDV